jgi:hypothetical protein
MSSKLIKKAACAKSQLLAVSEGAAKCDRQLLFCQSKNDVSAQ